MGGRGGSSGFPTGAPVPVAPQSAADTQDLSELVKYMSDAHSIRVDAASLAGQDFENVRNAAREIENLVNEFPQAAANYHELKGDSLRHGVLAQASFGGIIQLANHYFATRDKLLNTYTGSVNSNFHPEGSTGDHVSTHEAGHILERALIDKYVLSKGSDFQTRLEAGEAWRKNTYASKVISEAAKAAKKTPEGKGKTNAALIKSVSRYATANRSEALAECVTDYRANGANAKPLSVAVWSILKRELG